MSSTHNQKLVVSPEFFVSTLGKIAKCDCHVVCVMRVRSVENGPRGVAVVRWDAL